MGRYFVEFECTPEQYHGRLDMLWKAVEGVEPKGRDVFQVVCDELQRLREIAGQQRSLSLYKAGGLKDVVCKMRKEMELAVDEAQRSQRDAGYWWYDEFDNEEETIIAQLLNELEKIAVFYADKLVR